MKGFPDRTVFGDKIYFIELKLGKKNKSNYKQARMQKWEKQINKTKDIYLLLKRR